MMVYTARIGADHEGFDVVGVFSNQKDAIDFLVQTKQEIDYFDYREVWEHELDAPPKEGIQPHGRKIWEDK